MHMRRLVPALVLGGACGLLAAPGGAAAAARGAALKPPRGYRVVSSTTVFALSGEQTRGLVTCPRGLVPLSGGAHIDSLDPFIGVNSSFPLGNQWVVDVNVFGGADVPFEVTAVCAHQPKNYAVIVGPLVSSEAGSQERGVVSCPQGSEPLGGGVATSSAEVTVNVNDTFPAGPVPPGSTDTWITFINNTGADDTDFSVRAVCGKLPGYQDGTPGPDLLNPANSVTRNVASCPAPTVPIGGGALSSSSNLRVGIGGMGPSGSDFVTFMNNASGDDAFTFTLVICAGK
jgi:hypothetical protein